MAAEREKALEKLKSLRQEVKQLECVCAVFDAVLRAGYINEWEVDEGSSSDATSSSGDDDGAEDAGGSWYAKE